MGGLFQPKESSSQDVDDVGDGDEAVPTTQGTSGPDTAPDTNIAVADDENPF